MGKKFMKSNRHKKLKAVDPFYVGDRKVLIDKGLILANQAPLPNDLEGRDEKLPMKLRELLELKEKLKEKSKKKEKILPMKADDRGAEIPLRQTVQLKKLDHESDSKFLNRIEKETETVIRRSQYENQFDVRLDTKDNQIVVVKDKKMSERKRRALEKHRDRLMLKKTNSQLDKQNMEVKQDKVKFGEVVHQPPMITSFPKKRQNNANKLTIPVDKPGKNGVTEKDRNDVIYRYRMMKSQGKFK